MSHPQKGKATGSQVLLAPGKYLGNAPLWVVGFLFPAFVS